MSSCTEELYADALYMARAHGSSNHNALRQNAIVSLATVVNIGAITLSFNRVFLSYITCYVNNHSIFFGKNAFSET
jgi:hypothetical protein